MSNGHIQSSEGLSKTRNGDGAAQKPHGSEKDNKCWTSVQPVVLFTDFLSPFKGINACEKYSRICLKNSQWTNP